MSTLAAGDVAPAFELVSHTGEPYTLSPNTILFFYPAAFTPGCTGEVCDFRDGSTKFAAAGYELVGISPDPVEKLARFVEEYALPYALLSDGDHAVASSYGAWGMKKNYGKEYEGLIRSTIVIGNDGTVEHAWYNVRAKGHAGRVERELLAE